jgi:molybdopterin/thiamine biosynthesis adenylyltransferase
MDTNIMELSRISKLFLDRDKVPATEALIRRQQFNMTLLCGADIARSYTLQLAVLTAASMATRCFPGAVRVALPSSLRSARLLVWPALKWTFGRALADILGADALTESTTEGMPSIMLVFGDAATSAKCLRVTFDGWVAKVGPTAEVPRLLEREYCTLAGILAAALAVAELFLSFADINIEAGRRVVALSLWRPDLDPFDPASLGMPVEYLPKDLWLLGLGHLGNGYIWALATLPYASPREAKFALMDFDKVIIENTETGLIFREEDVGQYKTRVFSQWLEHRQFGTRIVERRFDDKFRVQDKEARLALCGFDSNPARRDLKTAGFTRVVESGLGGTAANFDTINLHTLPNPRPVEKLWPDLLDGEVEKQQEHQEQVARTNKAYADIHDEECGRIEMAGKAVAVPFVGTAAGALVVAEVLRLLHEGVRFTDLKIRLGGFGNCSLPSAGIYSAKDFIGITSSEARTLRD